MGKGLRRRDFLTSAAVGALVASGAQAQGRQADTAAHGAAHQPRGAPPERARLFLTDSEAALLTAIVDVMLPADSVGPGGVEAGIITFLDRQLAGGWGSGERLYLQGPWGEGTPQQGYQLPLTPAQLIRAALPELDRLARDSAGKGFSELSPERRDALLADLRAGKAGLAAIPGKTFISLLHSAVIEGYFADPAYGGNRDMAAWRMIGFPGARGGYVEDIEKFRGKRFTGEPVSLADLQ